MAVEQTENTVVSMSESNGNGQTYLIGAAVGLVLGLLAAYLFLRAAGENPGGPRRQIPTMDLLKLVLAVLGLIRQIAEAGKRS